MLNRWSPDNGHQVHRHSGAEPWSPDNGRGSRVLQYSCRQDHRHSGAEPLISGLWQRKRSPPIYLLPGSQTPRCWTSIHVQTIHGRRSRVLIFIDASIGSQTCTQVLNRGSLDKSKGSVALLYTLLSQTLGDELFTLGQYYSAEETESSIYLPQGSVTNAKAVTFDLLSRAKEAESFHLSASRFTRHQF